MLHNFADVCDVCVWHAGVALKSYELMQSDPVWIPVIASIEEGEWCKGDRNDEADFRKHLSIVAQISSPKPLSLATIRRLVDCFAPRVSFNRQHLDCMGILQLARKLAEPCRVCHITNIALSCMQTKGTLAESISMLHVKTHQQLQHS